MSDLYQTIADRLRARLTTASDVQAATSAAEINQMPLGDVPVVLVIPSAERWSPPRETGLHVTVSGQLSFSCVVGLTLPGNSAAWSAVRAEEAEGPVFATGARLLSWSADAGARWVHAFDFSLPAQASYGVQT